MKKHLIIILTVVAFFANKLNSTLPANTTTRDQRSSRKQHHHNRDLKAERALEKKRKEVDEGEAFGSLPYTTQLVVLSQEIRLLKDRLGQAKIPVMAREADRINRLEASLKKIMNKKLLNAVKAGRFKTVKTLLEGGAQVNTLNKNGANVLHLAALTGNEELVRFFLKKGVSPACKIRRGAYKDDTPLTLAQKKGRTGVARLLT